ncbi:hypothetical protein [Paramicrobacterium humi]|nr:hypothetical protein [Microbacterium humi]
MQTLDHMSPAAIYAFATKWGLEPYDRDFAFAWVEPDQLTDLMFERA